MGTYSPSFDELDLKLKRYTSFTQFWKQDAQTIEAAKKSVERVEVLHNKVLLYT